MYDLALEEMSTPLFLRTRRVALGLSQQQLAERVGTTQSVIAAIENKRRKLTGDMEAKLRQAMVASPVVLLERHRERIKAEAADFGFRNVRIFGSLARGDGDASSDIDIFVDVNDSGTGGVEELFALNDRLENVLSIPVDLKLAPQDTSGRPRLQKALAEAVAV